MTEEGYEISMRCEFLKMYDAKKRLVMKVQRSPNRLYKISLKCGRPVCLAMNLEEDMWVWHARMGHANFGVLEDMSKKGAVVGIPHISHPKQVCEGCLVAKQTRKPFPSEAQWRAKKPLELIHAFLCGPITPHSWGGNRYFLLLVDDCTRYMWVYLLKSKDNAFAQFKKFKKQVEQESSQKIKILRTDRGGEFISHQFNDYCQQEGIRRQLTAPYTPQQNGVVERRNRTVLNMTRSLLKTMKVPDALWGEAVRHSVYLLNRIKTKSVKETTPYEAWRGKKSKVHYLKVFGCVAYAKEVSKKGNKLSDRSVGMVYLGEEPGSKAHRLFYPKMKRIVVARDVDFDEKKQWPWKEVQNKEPMVQPSWAKVVVESQAGPSPQDVENINLEDNVMSQAFPNNPDSSLFESPGIQESQGSTSVEPITDSQNSSHEDPDSNEFYEHTPIQGFQSVEGVYQRSTAMTNEEVRHLYDQELLLINDEPTTYDEAAKDSQWIEAMKVELAAINKNKTWTLVQLPPNHKAIGLKWVFKLKRDADGKVVKHKARLVAKGYVQQKGVDFEDAFAPVARMETIRLILAIAATNGWLVHHLDVKSAFLYGDLKEEVYVSQPTGYEVKGKENLVYRLNKALYGLRQAPRAWYARLDKALKYFGFVKCKHEQAVYVIKKGNSLLIVGVYVDDIIVTGSKEKDITSFKRKMKSVFDMSDLGKLSFYLGIEVEQNETGVFLKQSAYAKIGT
ncbi:putative RNA-directed DNA polymerase [Helianthus annuus]|nr:putative RNA-directed DNA polymerase [Helianthus annuus]